MAEWTRAQVEDRLDHAVFCALIRASAALPASGLGGEGLCGCEGIAEIRPDEFAGDAHRSVRGRDNDARDAADLGGEAGVGGEEGVAVRLPGAGATSDEGQYLILDAADQKTGLYTLRLRIHDNISGRTAEREQDLFLE